MGSQIMLSTFLLLRVLIVTGLCLQGGRNQDKGTENESGAETG